MKDIKIHGEMKVKSNDTLDTLSKLFDDGYFMLFGFLVKQGEDGRVKFIPILPNKLAEERDRMTLICSDLLDKYIKS